VPLPVVVAHVLVPVADPVVCPARTVTVTPRPRTLASLATPEVVQVFVPVPSYVAVPVPQTVAVPTNVAAGGMNACEIIVREMVLVVVCVTHAV